MKCSKENQEIFSAQVWNNNIKGDMMNNFYVSDNFYVSIIGPWSMHGGLFGPYSREEAKRVLIEVLKSNRSGGGPIEITDEVLEEVNLYGGWEYDGEKGSVFIVQSEQYKDDDGNLYEDISFLKRKNKNI